MYHQLRECLKELWYRQEASSYYLFLLQQQKANVTQIASHFHDKVIKTKEILEDMVSLGYIHYIPDEDMYQAVSLQTIISSTQETCKKFELLLPEFEEVIQKYSNTPRIWHYEWISWLMKYYKKQLETNHDVYAFLWTSDAHHLLYEYLEHTHVPERARKGIHAKVIIGPGEKNDQYTWLDKMSLRETIVINHPLLQLASEIDLFWEDKVGFGLFSDEDMSATIIQSKELYTTIKSIFDFLRQEYHDHQSS